jgi:hypothetical protein
MNSQMTIGFKGLISICNTTITDFKGAIYCGHNGIVFSENSSIIYNRGIHGMYCINPRFVKITKTSFLKCEGNALCIDQENYKEFTDLNANSPGNNQKETFEMINFQETSKIYESKISQENEIGKPNNYENRLFGKSKES